MRVVVPGEADAAVNLNAFGRSTQISFRRGSLGQGCERGPFGIVHRTSLSRAVGGRLRQLHIQQHVSAFMLDGLKRTYFSSELNSHLRIVDRRIEQRLCAPHPFVGESDSCLVERTDERLCAVIEVAEE